MARTTAPASPSVPCAVGRQCPPFAPRPFLGAACRGFGVVSFPTQQEALEAVDKTNGMDIGGRTVTVRIDRFA